MKQNDKKTQAVTLTELLVVMAVMVILLAVAAPVAKKLAQSLGSSAGARNIIDAAMTSARAIAVREHLYAGVRFQQDNNGQFYLVFIVENDKNTNLAGDFCVVKGKNPIRLPENIGVMDGKWVDRRLVSGQLVCTDYSLSDTVLSNDPANFVDSKQKYYLDGCTFSIVFSPAGKVVTQTVRVCNQDGYTDTSSGSASSDKVFNEKAVVDSGGAMFYQDDYGGYDAGLGGGKNYGIAPETSRKNFIIFDKAGLARVAANKRWSGYLEKLDKNYVNPYTGELVNKN